MQGGIGWWHQITEALDVVKFIIIVMTPAAVESETTQKEWRYARGHGVCICPVKGVSDAVLDYESLPRWMRKAHFYDLHHEWETFVRSLKSPCEIPRVPHMAPEKPKRFVKREDMLGLLLSYFLDSKRRDPQTVTVALHGPGGSGKSTLAAALCNEDDIDTAFDDGILWVTLGKNPNLCDKLTELCSALTGKQRFFASVDSASLHLTDTIGDRNCLVVVDDVWDVADLSPFLRGGTNCARLITTRQFSVAIEAEPIYLGEMSPPEAVALLTAELPSVGLVKEPFFELAKRLSEWPLLLELANGKLRERIARKDTVERALEYLNERFERRGVTAFDAKNKTKRKEAITRTIEVSLELLSQTERERFVQLVVFPRNIDIPTTTVQALWGTSHFDAVELIEYFANLSLLKFDPNPGSIHLHSLIQDYMAKNLTNPTILHSRLLDAWSDRYDLPDVYAWRCIAYHLVGAKRSHELEELLFDYRWLKKKLEAIDIVALIDDFKWIQDNSAANLVKQALVLSDHVLVKDKKQLAGQLVGRLTGFAGSQVEELVEQMKQETESPWLCPLSPCLTKPGGPLIRTLKVHSARITAVAISSGGKGVLSASSDGVIKLWDLETGTERWSVRAFSEHSQAGSGEDSYEDDEEHFEYPKVVSFLPDPSKVLSISLSGAIKVMDFYTGKTLLAHNQPFSIYGATMLPDGDRVLLALGDGTLRLCSIQSGSELMTLTGHTDVVTCVAVSFDGKRVISGSFDGTLIFWNLSSGVESMPLTGHTDLVTSVAITSDGTIAVSGSPDQTVRIWNTTTGKSRPLVGHSLEITGVAITDEGKWILSSSADATLNLWDQQSGGLLRTLSGHSEEVTASSITPDGRLAVSGSKDGSLKFWNLHCLEKPEREGHTGPIAALAIAPAKRAISTTAKDTTLRVWDLQNGSEQRVLRGHSAEITSVAIMHDGSRAVSASNDTTLKLWDLETGAELKTLKGHSSWVVAVVISPDGRIALSGSYDATINIWDLAIDQDILMQNQVTRRCETAGFRPLELERQERKTGKWLTWLGMKLSGFKGLLRGTEGLSPKNSVLMPRVYARLLEPFKAHGDSITAIAISGDGRLALSASYDTTLRLWDLTKANNRQVWEAYSENTVSPASQMPKFADMVWILEGHKETVTAAAISPDGRLALSVSEDGIVKLWDLRNGKEKKTLASPEDKVTGIAITPDSQRGISASHDRTVKIWDLQTGDELRTLSGHLGRVTTIAVAPDGEFALSGSDDKTLKLWNLANGQVITEFACDGIPCTCAIARDGKTLVVGDTEGDLHFLRLKGLC